ncbi:hypothetical protein GCM10009118_22750 [Wandonia haliotis]|uniref:Uncharacterized protein n=1 Tax=Wandonia haliotis TaxID=574963 RepID=A0ABN1MRK4_9FLAO
MEDKIRHILALILVVSFIGIIGFLIIYPYKNELIGLTDNDNVMIKYLDKTASLFTGIIGVIIGYYFGNKNNNVSSK